MAEREIHERGWSLPGTGDGPTVRLRLDKDYHACFSSTFGHITVPLFAIRTPGPRSKTMTPTRSLFPHYPKMRSTDLLLEWECAVAADHPFRKAADALLFFSHGAIDIEDTTIERHAVLIGNAVPKEWLYLAPESVRDILDKRAVRDSKTGHPIIYASTDAHALKRFVDEKWNPTWKMTNGIPVWTVDRQTEATIHIGGEYTWGDCMEVRERFEWLQLRHQEGTVGRMPPIEERHDSFVIDGRKRGCLSVRNACRGHELHGDPTLMKSIPSGVHGTVSAAAQALGKGVAACHRFPKSRRGNRGLDVRFGGDRESVVPVVEDIPQPVVPKASRGVGGAVLVQTLREGEVLQVGSDIRVHIRRLKGSRVTFVIIAPEEVGIKRLRSPQSARQRSLEPDSD